MQEFSKGGDSSDNVNQIWWRNEHFKSQNPRILNKSGSKLQLNTAREVESKKIIQLQDTSEKACHSSEGAEEEAAEVVQKSDQVSANPESLNEAGAQSPESLKTG